MILLLAGLLAGAHACDSLSEVPDSFQVAWVSPLRQRVGSKEMIEVVRFSDLREWSDAAEPDAKRLLQHLGMVRGKARRKFDPTDYKITIFDVRSEVLCRPIDGGTGEKDGLSVCIQKKHRAASTTSRHGDTGCGYTMDTASKTRGMDVYRVAWRDASAYGFCVLPLSRFLEES
jgi:hypothetical protein